jgi:hypothetical protein
MGFKSRMHDWKVRLEEDVKKRWWWPLVGYPLIFLGELMKDRVIGGTNRFIDAHASLAWFRPVILVWQRGTIATVFYLGSGFAILVVLGLVIHAYAETRPPKRTSGRPKVIVEFDPSQRPKFSRTLQGPTLTKVGDASAHNVSIVPDKAKRFWFEQIGRVGTLLAGKSSPIMIRAMYLSEGVEKQVIGDDEPLRILLVTMGLEGLKAEIFIKLRYESFDGDAYETPFRFGVDDQHQPCFTLMTES